jgi:predicted hotdog family 3-hydroxylacyl-ACP dehydratase
LSTVRKYSVEDLVPHRGIMCLLDSVQEIDDHHTLASAVVKDSWPLSRDGSVASLMLIEVVAQAAAAWFGWQNLQQGNPGQIGYLVGVKEARFLTNQVAVGTRVEARVERGIGRQSFLVMKGVVRDDANLLAEARIQLFVPETSSGVFPE